MYQLLQNDCIRRLADNACIRAGEDNRDYQEYLTWLAAGNTPLPVETVEEIKARLWQEIKAKRDAIKIGGALVDGKWYHTDDASRIQQIGLVMMGANLPPGLQWKTLDGSFVTMTPALAGQVFQAVAALDVSAFAAAEQHRAAVYASTDPAAYDFSSGWPAIYEAQA